MQATIKWINVEDGLPSDGASILAAITASDAESEMPESDDFWLVMPMYFRRLHPVEDTGEVLENCFVDSDYIVRFPSGGPSREVVTHWAKLPNLPGVSVSGVYGADAKDALRRATES